MTSAALAVAGGGVDQVLELARRHLEMDVALLSEFVDGEQVPRRRAGDAASFGCELGAGTPLPQTYCQAMVRGQIPNAISDAARHPVVGALPATAAGGIGAYVGVPIRLSDGILYGSLCVLSHQAQPVDERDAKFLSMLAELVAREVEADRDQHALRERMAALLATEQIQIALQPIVDLATGLTVGVEALSRFPSGYGPPDVVFATAHAAGIGADLERLAMRRAMELLPLLGAEQYLAINLSPQVAIELGRASAQPLDLSYDRLVVEITEHALIENYTSLRDSLDSARERGLRLSIDDAGAGYASLHHIVQLAPDIIKVDRCLIDGIADSPALRSVAAAFVGLARDLGAHVVAEGVEQEADLRTVRTLGIQAAQGYLLARPSTDRDDLSRWRTRMLLPPSQSPVHSSAMALGSGPAPSPAAPPSLSCPTGPFGIEDRDLTADDRDRTSAAQDRVSEARDRRADARDARAADREQRLGRFDAEAAADRAGARRDRRGSAGDRKHSEDDRDAAGADRVRAAVERASLAVDGLTGAHQRAPGLAELEREIVKSRRTGQPLVLAFMDVDGLKAINDTRGHAAGDEVLQRVVAAVRRVVREYDLVIRYGGDEFICGLPDISLDDATNRFAATSRDLASHDVAFSVGLAALRGDDTLHDLIDRADHAMYEQRKSRASSRTADR